MKIPILTERQLARIHEVYRQLWKPVKCHPEFGWLALVEFSISYRCTATSIAIRLHIVDEQGTEVSFPLPGCDELQTRVLESIPQAREADDSEIHFRVADPENPSDINAIKELTARMHSEASTPLQREELSRYLVLTEAYRDKIDALLEQYWADSSSDPSQSERSREFSIRYYVDMCCGVSITLDVGNTSTWINDDCEL